MAKNSNFIPKLMGILNGTPDSFFPDSRIENISIKCDKYQYADIVDVGFESSRPGAVPLSENDELARLKNFLAKHPNFHQNLSIDTYKPSIAKIALENGFNMINDIMGGGKDGKMFEIASFFDCPIIIMHMKGNPRTMQIRPFYDDIIDELLKYFELKIKLARRIGVLDRQIILDPGIGFGKSVIDNDKIINNINKLKVFGFPVLIGISRKSFLSTYNDTPKDRLSASLGVTALAAQNGVDIIRTHDIGETRRMLIVTGRLQKVIYQQEGIS